MATKRVRQWWAVRIGYETQGGEHRTVLMKATSDYAVATRQRTEYAQTGYTATIEDVKPPPDAGKKPARGASHE